MFNREVRDLIFGILITVIVIFSFSFFGKKNIPLPSGQKPDVIDISDNSSDEKDLFQVEIDKRIWVIQCREALSLNGSQFNTKVDEIFYERHSKLKRSLTLNSEDTRYRLKWNIIAESLLKQNNNFDSNENCINEEIID